MYLPLLVTTLQLGKQPNILKQYVTTYMAGIARIGNAKLNRN